MATQPRAPDACTLSGEDPRLDDTGRKVVEQIEDADRRSTSRGGAFKFATQAAAAAGRAAVEGIAWRAQFATKDCKPRLDAVEVRCEPHLIERVVATLLSHGGKYQSPVRRQAYRHHDPLDMSDGYEGPIKLQARMADIEQLRERLASLSSEVDYHFDRSATLRLSLGKRTATCVPLSDDDLQRMVHDVEEIEEFVILTRRLIDLLS